MFYLGLPLERCLALCNWAHHGHVSNSHKTKLSYYKIIIKMTFYVYIILLGEISTWIQVGFAYVKGQRLM